MLLAVTYCGTAGSTVELAPGWLKVTVVQLPRVLGVNFPWVARGALLRLAPASDLALFFEDDHQLRCVCAHDGYRAATSRA